MTIEELETVWANRLHKALVERDAAKAELEAVATEREDALRQEAGRLKDAELRGQIKALEWASRCTSRTSTGGYAIDDCALDERIDELRTQLDVRAMLVATRGASK